MARERSIGPAVQEAFSSKKPLKSDDIEIIGNALRSMTKKKLDLIKKDARVILTRARQSKGFSWVNIREEGATMEKKRLWAPIYGNSVREFIFASQMIGLVKVIKHEETEDLKQEGPARRKSNNFIKYIRKGMAREDPKLRIRDFTGMSVDLSKTVQKRVGVQDDKSLYKKTTRWSRNSGAVYNRK